MFGYQALFCAGPIEDMRFWKESLQTRNLAEINFKVNRHAVKWPPIYSNGRRVYASDQEQQINADYARLAATLLDIINDTVNSLDSVSGENAIAGIEELLDTREWIAVSPSYQNYALIDTINRHVLVRLLELLTNQEIDSALVVRNLRILSNFGFDSVAWLTMLDEEKGAAVDSDAKDYGAFQQSNQQRVLERAGLRDLTEYHTEQLLKGHNFAALGWRMVVMDYHLRSVVPALLEYWQKAKAPAATDEYSAIRSELGVDALVPESVGAGYLERRRSSAAVYEILVHARNGKIRRHILVIKETK